MSKVSIFLHKYFIMQNPFLYRCQSLLLLFSCIVINAQHISDFTSITPNVPTADFQYSDTHEFQYIIELGDVLSDGSLMPYKFDFTGYVPINNSSTEGYLSINSEGYPYGAVTILDIDCDPLNQSWSYSQAVPVSMAAVGYSSRNCSGAVTPWGTVISCEEYAFNDFNGDGYKDTGWAIEIDPITKTVIDQPGGLVGGDKLWAMGNFRHENAAIHSNERTVYQGSDATPGYLFKFVANTAKDLSSGDLYVYKELSTTTGTWVQLNNTTQNEQNTTNSQANAVGAKVFSGVEDVEISPIDGKVYFAVKNEDSVYRLDDPNPLTGGNITNFETFVGNANYNINDGTNTYSVPWGTGNDNLAFDDLGNLWVLQDGGDFYIWVVGVNHTQSNPDVRLFGIAPYDSEPTGITFTPDYRYLFMSLHDLHPSNASTSQLDAFGQSKTFDKDVALAISRQEFLGSPLRLSAKIFLEGAYETGTGFMRTTLNQEGLLPTTQPYNTAPWNYNGSESLSTIPTNMVDWVLVEARLGTPQTVGTPQTTIVEQHAGILLNNGQIVDLDGVSPLSFKTLNGREAYHFAIRHRNHLDIITANAYNGANSNVVTLDFTDSSPTATLGTQQIKPLAGGIHVLYGGDYEADGTIQLTDEDLWRLDPAVLYTYDQTDGNMDGVIQTTDHDLWLFNKAKLGVAEIGY